MGCLGLTRAIGVGSIMAKGRMAGHWMHRSALDFFYSLAQYSGYLWTTWSVHSFRIDMVRKTI